MSYTASTASKAAGFAFAKCEREEAQPYARDPGMHCPGLPSAHEKRHFAVTVLFKSLSACLSGTFGVKRVFNC